MAMACRTGEDKVDPQVQFREQIEECLVCIKVERQYYILKM